MYMYYIDLNKSFKASSFQVLNLPMKIPSRVETGSGHPGYPGHVLSGSSGSDAIYKISKSDPDSALDHVH